MREIKFRQWNPDSKYWHYFEFTEGMCSGVFNATLSRYPIMQYTGLKDKNGVETYEGDIVRVLYTDWISKSDNDKRTLDQYKKDISSIGVVAFEIYEYVIKFAEDVYRDILPGTHGDIEVIGNIHENPELIEND